MNIIFISQEPLRAVGITSLLEKEYKECSPSVRHILPASPQDLTTPAEECELMLLDDSVVPDSDIEMLGTIAKNYSAARNVRYADPANSTIVYQVLSAGFAGYIPRHSGAMEIVNALKLVVDGGVYVPPSVYSESGEGAPLVVTETKQAPLHGGAEVALTPRQKEVLKSIANGMSNREIANKFSLSEGTIKIHIYNIFKILNVHNRVSALVAAKRLGYDFDKDG